MNSENVGKKDFFNLNFFGLKMSPGIAVVVGLISIFFFKGGILESIGAILFLIGIIKLIVGLFKKKKNN